MLRCFMIFAHMCISLHMHAYCVCVCKSVVCFIRAGMQAGTQAGRFFYALLLIVVPAR